MKEIAKIILIKNNTMLLHHRDSKPGLPFSDMWSLLGGLIDKGENPKEAVIRETKEEIIYEISDPQLIFEQDRMENNQQVHDYVFKANINKDLQELELTEGREIRFVNYNEALKLNLSQPYKELILKILKDLDSK